MKKVKFPIFIVLGLIIFVPFFIPAKAQTPSYVSVNVGEYYQWDMSIHYGDWDSWFNDNMTYWWDLVWNQTNDGSDLTTIHDSWIAAGPAPQCGNPVTVEVIHPENTTAGTTDVFSEGGYLVLNYIGIGYGFSLGSNLDYCQ